MLKSVVTSSELAAGLTEVVCIAFGMQMVVFILHAAPNRSEKYFDVTGSITFLTTVVYSFLKGNKTPAFDRPTLVSFCVLAWAIRLGTFLLRRILRDKHDRRMKEFKANLVLFAGTWSMQGSWVSVVALPAYLLNLSPESSSALGWVDALGLFIWASGWALQLTADYQKWAFRNEDQNKNRFITAGVWRYSRHPNYFGEMALWFGLSLVAWNDIGGDDGMLAFASPLFTVFLLSFLSGIPLLEQYANRKWGKDKQYMEYKAQTSILIPWIPSSASRSTVVAAIELVLTGFDMATAMGGKAPTGAD